MVLHGFFNIPTLNMVGMFGASCTTRTSGLSAQATAGFDFLPYLNNDVMHSLALFRGRLWHIFNLIYSLNSALFP